MSDDGSATLIRMANQISLNYSYLVGADHALAVANHLKRFWTPAMREQFLASAGSAELEIPVRDALVLIAN